MSQLLKAFLATLFLAAAATGCVARVETDPAPASGTVDVDVDPPRRGPDVNVKVD
jgi:hypothetical protein